MTMVTLRETVIQQQQAFTFLFSLWKFGNLEIWKFVLTRLVYIHRVNFKNPNHLGLKQQILAFKIQLCVPIS